MRPLPRLHAVTDPTSRADPDLRIRIAAIAAVGPAVALHARDREATDREVSDLAVRMLAHARPPEAAVFVNARPDIAQAVGAHGVQLGTSDLSPREARTIFRHGWIGASVHNRTEAAKAVEEGADFLLLGSIFPTKTHPEQVAIGVSVLEEVARLGLPVIAIGGMTAERAVEVHQAGAYGIAAVSALWGSSDAATVALELLAPWVDDHE